MAKTVIGDWLVWTAETIDEGVEIAQHFKKLKEEGKKGGIFQKLGKFLILSDNVTQLPGLIMRSGDVPTEWANIEDHKEDILQGFAKELDALPDEVEPIVVQGMKMGIEIGKFIEMIIELKETKANS